jgi:excisionase family DNA binding protein
MNKEKGGVDTGNCMLTVHDLAVYLRLSDAMVYKLARAGQMPSLRVGKSWRFKKELIDDWILRETGQNALPLEDKPKAARHNPI